MTMSEYATISYHAEDGLAVLELDSAGRRKGLDTAMSDELGDVLGRIRADGDLHALLLTSADGGFCAGDDLRALGEGDDSIPDHLERIRRLHDWMRDLVDLELPVIAAVDGPAIGAGFNLVLAADFVLCSTRARFCAVFGQAGLLPELGGFFLLPRTIGMHRAKDLIMTGRLIDAQEALRLGIAAEIHPPEALRDNAILYANRFRHASREAIGIAKSILNQSFHLDQHALAEMEAYGQAICLSTDYHKAAVQRFLDKEPPLFDWERLVREEAAQ